ncbi:Outer membrane protein assembly factor BamE [Candidatus Erwinia haradaeae]|uniref:Outer membrane protein assembly factor BamE n=1 Tax=Candidatus Erwinia haradaeae TaxID=1922217 RepID=A0A451DIW6_9GAMM|nr:outer membrane protein assembly factor BamE [Candidatus Erwinia haradaeae]VFP86607.1 Outer membrane protein assembly factor BamE [Candidatus Erwinia haradaeae]
MISYQTLITMLIALTITSGCSISDKLVYHPDLIQGNYLSHNNLVKIRIGMTQEQVRSILGTPQVSDPFGSNIWYYVCRQKIRYRPLQQQTLKLVFNHQGILTNVNNQRIIFTHREIG